MHTPADGNYSEDIRKKKLHLRRTGAQDSFSFGKRIKTFNAAAIFVALIHVRRGPPAVNLQFSKVHRDNAQ